MVNIGFYSEYSMFICDSGIFPFDIMVCFGDKRKMFKSLEKYIPKSGLVEFKRKTFKKASFCMFNGGQSVIWLYKKPSNIEDLSFLNHEIFHAVYCILERVGITLTESSEETFAYLTQYLTKKIYNELVITFS
jgi:hypothetical protein